MTRDFSKHERDDERPYSRNSSSGRNGEERSPRPARPRLNRDTVDKAWENGARQNHPDYRARNTQGGQPPRDNWRRQQQSGQSSAYNGRNNTNGNNRAPYGNRPNDRRQDNRTPNRYQGSQPRPFESGMRKFDERQYNERQNYQPRPSSGDSRPQSREDTRYSNNRPPSRNYDSRHDDRQPRSFDRDNRQPRSFDRDDRQPRSFDRDDRQPRSFGHAEPHPRGYYREKRQERASGRPDPQNSRWQSRPQRFTPKSNDSTHPTPPREQFEGDYEQFAGRTSPSEMGNRRESRQPDRHATHKPREAQAQSVDAEFMTEVQQETDTLIQHIVPTQQASNGAAEHEVSPKAKKARTGTRSASAKVRSKKTEAKQTATNPGTPHLRPSHRGFKWPESAQTEEQISESGQVESAPQTPEPEPVDAEQTPEE